MRIHCNISTHHDTLYQIIVMQTDCQKSCRSGDIISSFNVAAACFVCIFLSECSPSLVSRSMIAMREWQYNEYPDVFV